MNVNSIMYQSSNTTGMGNMSNNSPFLSIGSKGQIVEGVISKVSDKISINFNGVEVSVPHSAVRDATEGETRKFQIMDVSKDNIVLKEATTARSQNTTRTMVNTKAPSNAGMSSSHLSESAQVAAGEQEAAKNIAILTGEDYENIEKEEGAVDDSEEFTSLERAVERIKEYKEWETNCQESNEELCKELEEGLENIQKHGFLDQKSESEIAQILRDADIPATLENISKVVAALKMSQMANIMSDNARAYIIGNDMSPTIKNIYHGHYSGSNAFDGSVYDSEAWNALEGQIKDIIVSTGLDTGTAVEDAKWLFANDLPLTVENLKTLDVLRDIKENMTLDKTLMQIVQAMSAGNEAEDALLDTSKFIIARDIINDFQSITDGDIRLALNMAGSTSMADSSSGMADELTLELINKAKKGNENREDIGKAVIPSVITDGMTEQDIQAVTAKRHIAEICLKMTVQSVSLMAEKGINIETAPLEDIVKELRDIENSYYMARFGASGDITEKELGIMQEALQKTSDIANAPVSLIGVGVKQMNLLSFNELHAAAVSETSQRHQFLEIYEKVATEPGEKYGDSFEKAFQKSVVSILDNLGLEDTQANERAVRILGHNSMEITEDNINAVKDYDTSLNRVIDNMKPSVVLDMIRNGGNPLDKTIRELDTELSEIAAKKDISSEEKYSRYLWQLERSNAITEQEREGYIGVYRLLNNIEKTDGAAIGAVMQSKKEMTLGNLLTAVRSVHKSINIKADSSLGGLDSLVYQSKSITAQISNGFNSEQNKDNKNRQDGSRYYEGLVAKAIDNITPDSVNELSDGDMEKLLNTSLEKFAEEMKYSSAGKQLVQEYYEKQAEEVREIINNRAAAEEYLKDLQIPVTVAALGAAEHMLEEGYSPVKDCYNRRNILRDKDKEEFEKIADNMTDALESEDSMKKECEKAGRYMEEILARSYSVSDISSDELMQLKMLGRGIQLNGMMANRRSYDIPIVTGDTVTNMNVTILTGSADKGRVQVYIDNTKDSNDINTMSISAEFKMSGSELKGLIICGNRENYETLRKHNADLEQSFKNAGFIVKNISYSMGNVLRGSITDNNLQNTSAKDLYRAAKITVKYISNIVKNNSNES